jgi:hypothetical protein
MEQLANRPSIRQPNWVTVNIELAWFQFIPKRTYYSFEKKIIKKNHSGIPSTESKQ